MKSTLKDMTSKAVCFRQAGLVAPRFWTAFLLACLAWYGAVAPAHAANKHGLTLRSQSCSASFDSAGTLLSVGRTSQEPLARLLSLKIYDRTQETVLDDASLKGAVLTNSTNTFIVKKQSEHLGIEYRLEYELSDGLASKVTLRNRTDQLRCMEIEYRFRLEDAGYVPFFPGRDDFPDWPEGKGVLIHDYIAGWQGTPLTLPMGTLFARERGVGISFVAEFEVPIQSFAIRMERSANTVDVVVSRTRIRLDPRGTRSVTTYFVPHAGGWRCGLGFARDKWPEFFYVTKGAEQLQGYWHDFAIPTVTREWFGNYYSDKERWRTAIGGKWWYIHQHPQVYPREFLEGKPARDADWRRIVEWIESRSVDEKLAEELRKKGGPGNVRLWKFYTREEMRAQFAQNRKRGMPTMMYWNPSEVWVNYANDVFKGYEVPGWLDGQDWALCNVHPGSPVENTYWQKAKAIIDNYSNLSGLHVDQAYYGWEDKRHDDGFSIDEQGRPFSDLHRNIGRLVKKVTDYAHEHGMYTDQNHPYASIELSGWCDLALVEGASRIGAGMEPGRYITIGNRNCINLRSDQDLMQLNFRNGWFTNREWDPKQDIHKLPERSYFNWLLLLNSRLFELYRGREWVLEPNCLELPPGYDGNLFRRPDGNYVATVITCGDVPWSPYWRMGVPVRIRIEEASAVKAAYFISGDILGPRKLDFKRQGKTITLALPRHRSASAVLLGLSGHFTSIGPGLALKAEANEKISLLLDNFTDKPWDWQGRVEGATPERMSASVLPGETREVGFTVTTPEATPCGFFTFPISANSLGVIPSPDPPPFPQDTFTVEFALEDALSVWITPQRPLVERTISNSKQGGDHPFWKVLAEHVVAGERATLELGLSNNTDSEVRVALSFQAKGVELCDAPEETTLLPRRQKRVELEVTGLARGKAEVAVTVVAGESGSQASAEYKFDVVGKRLRQEDLGQVQAINLIADLWGRTSANKEKPISLNNTDVGVLEGGHATDIWITRVRTKLSENAVRAIRVNNTLKLENPQNDNFKIRNVFLEIVFKDGTLAFLRANPQAYSTLPDWKYAEGIRFSEGTPMVWPLPASQAG